MAYQDPIRLYCCSVVMSPGDHVTISIGLCVGWVPSLMSTERVLLDPPTTSPHPIEQTKMSEALVSDKRKIPSIFSRMKNVFASITLI